MGAGKVREMPQLGQAGWRRAIAENSTRHAELVSASMGVSSDKRACEVAIPWMLKQVQHDEDFWRGPPYIVRLTTSFMISLVPP
jgi:hypothetical protein